MDSSPKIEKGTVEQALAEKLQLAQEHKKNLKCGYCHSYITFIVHSLNFTVGCKEHIARVEEDSKVVSSKLERWINFRVSSCNGLFLLSYALLYHQDVVEHGNSAKIACMKEAMKKMSQEEAELEGT